MIAVIKEKFSHERSLNRVRRMRGTEDDFFRNFPVYDSFPLHGVESAMRRWDNKVYQPWRTVTTEQENKQSFELRPSKRVYIAQFRPSVSLCRNSGSRRNSSDPSPI